MSKAPGPYSYRNIWKVAYPILISLVMEQMIGLTDTAFLGRVGEVELGASAIAIVYYMVLFMIGFGFSIGAQIIIGRRNGEGHFRETGKVFWNGLYFVLGLSGIIILLSELTIDEILEDSPIKELSDKYKQIAIETDEETAYKTYSIDTLIQDGYSETFANYLIGEGKFNVAHAVGTQKDLSMDMKVMTIFTHQ